MMVNFSIYFIQVPFYRPTKERHKIIIDECPFPSDLVSYGSHCGLHNDMFNFSDFLFSMLYSPKFVGMDMTPPLQSSLHLVEK